MITTVSVVNPMLGQECWTHTHTDLQRKPGKRNMRLGRFYTKTVTKNISQRLNEKRVLGWLVAASAGCAAAVDEDGRAVVFIRSKDD